MIFDKQALFSDAQAITATAASTNTIDLGATGTIYGGSGAMSRDLGNGSPVALRIQAVETFNNLTSLTVTLEQDDTAAFSSAKSITLAVLPLADLVAGGSTPFDFMPKGVTKQFIRLKYTVAGTGPTTGKITAGVVAGAQTAPA